MKFTLRRSGKVTMRPPPGIGRCGVEDEFPCRYEVVLVAEGGLDKRGFLVDQLAVDQLAQSQEVNASCELAAKDLAERIARHVHINNQEVEILVLDVTLSPRPYAASITYHYRG